MPWPYNPDAAGRSAEREKAISDCKLYWSYESPWPDYDSITEEIRSRDVYGRLRISYDENLEALSAMVSKYLPEWHPRTDDDGQHFCKTPTINLSFPEYDAFILYCFVRQYQPRRIIELGSGMSTRVLVEAGHRNDVKPHITCVDRYASDTTKHVLGQLDVTFLDADIPTADLSLFETLEAGDILFVDSSHVLKNFGDVEYEFMAVIPSLKPGVVVHVHDIFLPFNYPLHWLIGWRCVLTEQQILAAYLHDNARVKILAANHNNAIRGICSPSEIEFRDGGSFWFQIV